MSRTQIILFTVIALILILVLVLAFRTGPIPFLPDDEEHRDAVTVHECLVCHGAGESFPRSANHPLGEDCFRCHSRR